MILYLARVLPNSGASTDLAGLEVPVHVVLGGPGHALLVGGNLQLQLPQLGLAEVSLEASLSPSYKDS